MNLDFSHKKIGIWGFGVSGKATLAYLLKHHATCTITILDKKLNPKELENYQNSRISFVIESDSTRETFLHEHDSIIPSPGIDLKPYQQYAYKFLAELDLFYALWKKPIIAITGTLGKTSITHLIDTIMRHTQTSLATGGNIGIGMAELITHTASCALLELSSFQLEHVRRFAPDYAIITNLYPNHLDRHGSMQEYWHAKLHIIRHQKAIDTAIVPLDCAHLLRTTQEYDTSIAERSFIFTHARTPTLQELNMIRPHDVLAYLTEQGSIAVLSGEKYTTPYIIVPAEDIPTLSYPVNWVIITALLYKMGLDVHTLFKNLTDLTLPEYRLEEIATVNNATYYNDSKSTIIHATIAAVKTLQKKHGDTIILLLGGTSKGVDRLPEINTLTGLVRHIICFGAEAHELLGACLQAGISATATKTLEEAVHIAQQHATANAAVLLSPGGASFDLFKDYKERGEAFKQLIFKLLP